MIAIIIATVAPALVIMAIFIRADRNKPEPRHLVYKVFLAGVVSALAAVGIEIAAGPLVYLVPPAFSTAMNAFIVIALTEEAVKLAALLLVLRKRNYFDEVLDGVVYAVAASTGFAVLENFLYVFGSDTPMAIALWRSFTAIPAHALFAGFMGLALGRSRIEGKGHVVGALLLATFLHGLYDWILMEYVIPNLLIFPVLVIGYIVLVRRIRKARDDDEAAGRWLSKDQLIHRMMYPHAHKNAKQPPDTPPPGPPDEDA